MDTPSLELLDSLVRECSSIRDNESTAIAQLRLFAAFGVLQRAFKCPPVADSRFEYHIKGLGFVDLALFHEDGGISLVEAKGAQRSAGMAAGIGQLFLYEAEIKRQKNPPWVKKYLCAPVSAEAAMPTYRACVLAGVRFIPLSAYSRMREMLAETEFA